ncbi:unnamed protein product [Rotaria socialis]|uniref:Uncharacterized protein n=1 Tax=Rotaria socialis TaxID=392032 RepID=A0A817TTK6_9BILA|nr:unnamed protein product [Rotaria socialis]
MAWWAFSSCTTLLGVLESDLYLGKKSTRTLFSIDSINARTIRGHAHFTTEDEILLLPGTYFGCLTFRLTSSEHRTKTVSMFIKLPPVADCLQYVQDSKYLIARERCEFISRLLNNNEHDNNNHKKRSKETVVAPAVFSLTPTSTHTPRVQKNVISSRKTTLLSSGTKKSASSSQSSSDESSQSPPLKKQKNKNNKLIKKQKQQHVLKTTTEQGAPAPHLRSIPILSRLRVRPNDHTAGVSSSYSTSLSEPGLIATISKNKQTARVKKRQHSSKHK